MDTEESITSSVIVKKGVSSAMHPTARLLGVPPDTPGRKTSMSSYGLS